jgi:hypothetical protein
MRALQRNESVLARSGPALLIVRYPLVEVKQKWGYASAETANDPKRKWGHRNVYAESWLPDDHFDVRRSV